MMIKKDVGLVLLIASGVIFIIAGLMQLLGAFPLYGLSLIEALGLAFLASGIILLILGLLGVKVGGSAVLLAISLCVLMVISSGALAIFTPGRLEDGSVAIFRTAEFSSVSELSISCEISSGSLEVYSTPNRSLLLEAEYYVRPGMEPTIEHEVVGGRLSVFLKAGAILLRLFVASWLPWSLTASTSLGSIEAEFNITSLRSLRLSSALGSITLSIMAQELLWNSTITASTGLGSLDLNLTIGPSVGCQVRASTSLGSIDRELEGFEVVSSGWDYLLIRSEGYASAEHFLDVSLSTSLGSIDVWAERRA